MSQKDIQGYRPGERVIYPAHGVGEVVGLEKMDVGDSTPIEIMVIKFENDRMTLRLPLEQLQESGLRPIASKNKMNNALKTLKGKSRNKTTMWARRAQEYEGKINSGDPVAVAEVLRDLFRRDDQPEPSYSERQLYQEALSRLADELAIVEKTNLDDASRRVEETLGRVFKTEEELAAEAAEAMQSPTAAPTINDDTGNNEPEDNKANKAEKSTPDSAKKPS